MKERIIYVEGFRFRSFAEIAVVQAANQHMRASIAGIIDKEFATECEKRSICGDSVSVWVYDDSNERHIWLAGLIENYQIAACGDVHTLTLEIISHSAKSDIYKHTRTFQDVSLTYEDIISLLKQHSGEEGAEVLIANYTGKAAIDTFLVQYEETDWEFLQRLASRCHSYLFASATINRNGVSFGMYPHARRNVLSTMEYTMHQDVNAYRQKEINSVSYIIESNEIYNLCDCIYLNEQELYVYGIDSKLVGSQLVHTYKLKPEPGFRNSETAISGLTGVALTARVKEVEKDTVRIIVDGDIEQRSYRWFPYSTIYSSPDNTGWYFMPETGDQVRLVFPDDSESNSYVVSSVHMGGRDEPDIKSIRTRYQKAVVFAPDSIVISNGAGSHIELHDSDGITIYSDKQIVIESEDNINIKGRGEVNVQGGEGVTLQQNKNRIEIDETIDITAGCLRLR